MKRAGVASAARSSGIHVVAVAIAAAWLLTVVVQATGNSGLLHHHALIEGDVPLWLAVPLFLLAWQAMIAAMMLPASLPAIRPFAAAAERLARPGLALAGFLSAYAVVWTVFGLLAFLGDVVLHHAVHGAPWLEASPWLIEAGVLALAGAYQFAPFKRSSLMACRHPSGLVPSVLQPGRGAFRPGLEHGFACLSSSWALMLVMFAAGFANVLWMALLTVVMVYETTGRHGQRAASAVGVFLLLGALAVLIGSAA